VGVEANRVTPITITSLMAMSLLGSAPRAQTIQELRDGVDDLRAWATPRGIRFTSDFEDQNIEHMREIIDHMVNSELINRYDQGPETVYAVAEDQHPVANYYRNTIVHHFVTKAIAELALLQAATATAEGQDALNEFWQESNRLRDVFKFEFFYSPTEEFNRELERELDQFDPHWQQKLKADPSWATTFITNFKPLVAHAVLRPYVEAYRVVAEVFARLDADQGLEKKASMTASFKYARQAYMQRRINSKASIGQILFNNGFSLLESYGLVEGGGAEIKERRRQVSRNFRVLAHRLEHIRALALPNELD
jgi:glycerol-3-phosphate O-acyltransferase